ncbi:retrotransposon protein, putative, ty1-copia subclass [Tanacetum coccineum]
MNTSSNVVINTHVAFESDGTLNDVTPVCVVIKGVTPSVVDMDVKKEKLNSLEDTVIMGSFPYANVTGKPSRKKLNIRTLFTPGVNGIDVVVSVDLSTRLFSFQFSSMEGLDAMLENGPWFIWNNLLILKKRHPDKNLLREDVSTISIWVKLHGVPITAFSNDGLSAIATKLGTPLMLDSYTSDMCMQSWGRLSYDPVMIELRADVELKENIIMAMPKIIRDGHYICNNTCASEKKNLKKPSQTSRGVPVGLKMGFKPQKEYRPIFKKPTASSSGNKKNGVAPTIEVSNSNPFEVHNSVNNEATSSGSSFINIDNSSTRTTPIIEKIGKFEELFTSKKATLVDEASNSLKKVEYLDDYDSEDEVTSVDNDMAHSMASERVGFGTQSLLEQWRDSYGNGDYDDDPNDDDMYEGHDLSQELQAICDNLDIRVRGSKKK